MNPLRKIIGLFLIVFIGLPLLFAMTWTAGVTRAAVSPAFIAEVPRQVIAAIPDMTDEWLAAGRNPNVISDPQARAWFEAAAKAETSPKQLLAKTGILDWMGGELTRKLTEVGDVLRGTEAPNDISLDLRPLKKALLSPEIDAYLLDVLKNLPPCDQAGLQEWARASSDEATRGDLPPCQPDLGMARAALALRHDRGVRDIPDGVPIFENVHWPRFGITRSVALVSYGLFIFPAIFILGGAAIAARSRASFLKWSGVSTLIGGVLSLGLALIVRNSASIMMHWAPWSRSGSWASGFGPLFLEKTRWAVSLVLDKLFSPVTAVAGVVCAVGLILFAFSFTARTQP